MEVAGHVAQVLADETGVVEETRPGYSGQGPRCDVMWISYNAWVAKLNGAKGIQKMRRHNVFVEVCTFDNNNVLLRSTTWYVGTQRDIPEIIIIPFMQLISLTSFSLYH